MLPVLPPPGTLAVVVAPLLDTLHRMGGGLLRLADGECTHDRQRRH
jgi:hypothetical protein